MNRGQCSAYAVQREPCPPFGAQRQRRDRLGPSAQRRGARRGSLAWPAPHQRPLLASPPQIDAINDVAMFRQGRASLAATGARCLLACCHAGRWVRLACWHRGRSPDPPCLFVPLPRRQHWLHALRIPCRWRPLGRCSSMTTQGAPQPAGNYQHEQLLPPWGASCWAGQRAAPARASTPRSAAAGAPAAAVALVSSQIPSRAAPSWVRRRRRRRSAQLRRASPLWWRRRQSPRRPPASVC
jgi:hypothetical protein